MVDRVLVLPGRPREGVWHEGVTSLTKRAEDTFLAIRDNISGVRVDEIKYDLDVSAEEAGKKLANDLEHGSRIMLVGYSAGGAVAAWAAVSIKVTRLLLLNPAMDAADRQTPKNDRKRPAAFSRPTLRRGTWIVRGKRETEAGGGAPWRIDEWANSATVTQVYLSAGHDLEKYLSLIHI